jgi:transposase
MKGVVMHIACVKNHGVPYLQVMESYSEISGGVRKDKKRSVRNLGPLSRFDDGKPNFMKRLRDSFKDGHPIIEELNDLIDQDAPRPKVHIEFDPNDPDDYICDPKNIGYFFLDSLYDSLGIYDVLSLAKSRSEIGYDINGLAKLLVFGRVLEPGSKQMTFKGRDDYLFPVVNSDNQIEIYRALDVLDEKADAIQKRMNLKIAKGIGRDTDLCFYDVTNYWFEIEDNDVDIADDFGKIIIEGLRKSGPSKAKNRKPIVQMGLFIDSNGIPIAYRLFPGNHIDQTTLRPALKKTIEKMEFGRVVIVADGGLNSGKNIARILEAHNGYIVSKSAKGSNKDTRAWILDEAGYVWNETQTFKSKSVIRERTVTDENGKKVKIKEKLVSYWSKKQYDHAIHENKKFIGYLNAVIENPDKLKDKQRNIEKFLDKEEVDKETGEVLDTVTVRSLDMDKLQEYFDIMGYYTIMTSEIDMSDREVIDKYHGLSRIEDSFRIIKSDLEGRPVYVRTKEHINAHFLICFIALTMIRIIQYKVLVSQSKETKNVRGWESGITADNLKKALSDFRADALPGGYFRTTKITEDLASIFMAFGVDMSLKLPNVKEIRELKLAIDKVDFMHL